MWGEPQPPQWSHVGFTLMYLKGGQSEPGIEFAPALPCESRRELKISQDDGGDERCGSFSDGFIQMADLPF